MKKAEYKFNKDRQEQIRNFSTENEPHFFYFKEASNKPIFIPKRKKKK
jgi:hypothetical protein